MHSLEDNKIYIIFSATPLKLGKFIRIITRNKYNHISISLDASLQNMYSFARYYKSIPFYGGFVRESYVRFKNKNKLASIKVCEIALSPEKYNLVKKHLKSMEINNGKYTYNLFSAILVPIKKRVLINNSSTCVEFAVDLLSKIDDNIINNRFYKLRDLEEYLKDNMIYEGEMLFKENNHEGNYDCFLEKKNFFQQLYYTILSIKRLTSRLINRS